MMYQWVVKNIDYSSRGPMFDSQHPQFSSQLSVTPVAVGPMPSSSFHWYCTNMIHQYTNRQNIHTNKENLKLFRNLVVRAESGGTHL